MFLGQDERYHLKFNLRLLLDYGANPSGLNNQLETPSHSAARAGNLNALKILVDRGGLNGLLSHRRQPSQSLPASTNSFDNRSNFMLNGGSAGGRSDISAAIKSTARRRRGAVAAASDYGSASRNLLSVACESEKSEVVEYLIEEIIRARRENFLDRDPVNSLNGNNYELNNRRRSSGMDIHEFMEGTDPRQAVFMELGSDLAASNTAVTHEEMENSIYGRMLAKTPKAFLFLLDSCVHAHAKETFVDFFPFYNCDVKSELNILKAIVYYKRFEMLTHPVCEVKGHVFKIQIYFSFRYTYE